MEYENQGSVTDDTECMLSVKCMLHWPYAEHLCYLLYITMLCVFFLVVLLSFFGHPPCRL